jgi:hypothetical protein
MRIWRRSTDPLVRHLLELGLRPEQVRRHMERVAAPPPAAAYMRPKAHESLSWASRIQAAEVKRKTALAAKARSDP